MQGSAVQCSAVQCSALSAAAIKLWQKTYHHDMLSTKDNKTIKKMYIKQKEDKTKDDLITLLEEDVKFIGIK